MAYSSPRPRRTFVALTLAVLAIFGGLVVGLTLNLRGRLREEVLRREAESIHAVALLALHGAPGRLSAGATRDSIPDLLAAVLESSRLRGVMAVQLFDPAGALQAAMPATESGESAPGRWWPENLAAPTARYAPLGSLEGVYGLPTEPGSEPTRVPLLEVVVPLEPEKTGASSLGTARYWLDGAPIAAEWRRMDRGLGWQAGLAYGGGAVLLIAALAWAFRRLELATERLVEQSADLARANQELDFAAKTGALGAISAHLIHGLKNPLAGLEGFVSEGPAPGDVVRGQAWAAAMETTRRLRAIVTDVVTVLGDESAGENDYPVPVAEILQAATRRAEAMAGDAGVELVIGSKSEARVSGRTANLAGLVLANLIANAVEALPRRGRVTLTAQPVNGTVDFLVCDDGPGLPAAVRAALFRPVRSAKPGGGGLGLAISARLAKHAGGNLEWVDQPGPGTAFRLRVPAV